MPGCRGLSYIRAVVIGVGQEERELVAADPERPVRATQAGVDDAADPAEQQVARRVPVGIVDLLELVEIEQDERQRPVVPGGGRPLPLHLFLERAMVAQTGQAVEQGLGAGLVVRALERAQALLESFGGLEHAVRQPDREEAQADREPDDDQGRQHQRRALAPRRAVHHRGRDRDRDREHGDRGRGRGAA